MKIEHKEVKKDLIRVTTADERWYKIKNNWLPSVTWVCEYYWKSPYLIKWIADKGLNEAENVKRAAGDKGSRVHQGIEDLLKGVEVKHDAVYSANGEEPQEITAEEYEAIISFGNWWKEAKPELIASEQIVNTDKYAGTLDLVCKIGEENWLIDLKTSQNIYRTHEIQVAAYKNAYKGKIDKLGILQVGYSRNKKGYKLTEIKDKIDLFWNTYAIWDEEVSQKQPPQREYPLSIKL